MSAVFKRADYDSVFAINLRKKKLSICNKLKKNKQNKLILILDEVKQIALFVVSTSKTNS